MKKPALIKILQALPLLFLAFSSMAMAEDVYRLEITMTEDEASSLKSSSRKDVPQAQIKILHNGSLLREAAIALNTRGQSSLFKYPRKNLGVKLLADATEPLRVGPVKAKKLILSASPEDILVTKNLINYGLFRAVGITTLNSEYAEVVINGRSQGLYMVTRQGDDFLSKTADADVVFRRRTRDRLELKNSKTEISPEEIAKYQQALETAHKHLGFQQGEAAYEALSRVINMEQYFKFLAVSFLVRNGDYEDELFFFGKKDAQGNIKFDVMPWDLDDTFAQEMHNGKFSTSINYGMKETALRQLLFGYESSLDQAIASNAILLQKYHEVAEATMRKLSDQRVMESIFSGIESRLTPYLNNRDVLENGRLDSVKKAHNPTEVLAGLENKEKLLEARVLETLKELEKIKSENPGSRVIPRPQMNNNQMAN